MVSRSRACACTSASRSINGALEGWGVEVVAEVMVMSASLSRSRRLRRRSRRSRSGGEGEEGLLEARPAHGEPGERDAGAHERGQGGFRVAYEEGVRVIVLRARVGDLGERRDGVRRGGW